jgi:ABC-type Fe3+-hydroxamate transport system substrate-binding protein
MKKKWLILSILIFLLAVISLTVNAQDPNLELTPATQTVNQGSQVTINVEVEDVANLQGANITLNFDALNLQYAACADGGFIPNATILVQSVDNTNGSVTISGAGLGEGSYASGSGTIMTVTFDTMDTGTTDITFENTTLRDNNDDDITHTSGSGCSVTINN